MVSNPLGHSRIRSESNRIESDQKVWDTVRPDLPRPRRRRRLRRRRYHHRRRRRRRRHRRRRGQRQLTQRQQLQPSRPSPSPLACFLPKPSSQAVPATLGGAPRSRPSACSGRRRRRSADCPGRPAATCSASSSGWSWRRRSSASWRRRAMCCGGAFANVTRRLSYDATEIRLRNLRAS